MNKKLIVFSGVVFVAVYILILGVSFSKKPVNKTTNISNQKIQVVTSFYPLYFFTSEIAADKAEIVNLTPAGSEPHDYELTTKDRVEIERSKLFVLNGGGFEPWGNKVTDDLKGKDISIIRVSEGLVTAKDPHVWLAPSLAKKQVEKITQALSGIDPINKSTYEDNAKKLENRLDELDKLYKEGLSNCVRKDFITSHEAFGYLSESYNLNQVAISGISIDEEPSPQQLVEVAKFARDNNVKYIFFETLLSPKLSQTIADEVGAKTLVLDPIEGLSDDNIRLGKNYFTLMESNLKNLQKALECKIL